MSAYLLPAKTYPRASASSIGITLASDVSAEDQPEALKILASIDQYLSQFCESKKCICCDASLGGWFGCFEWGLAHGEGFCGNCGYPGRGYHTILDYEHKPILEHAPIVLQYHPETLRDKSGRMCSIEHLTQVFKPRTEFVL